MRPLTFQTKDVSHGSLILVNSNYPVKNEESEDNLCPLFNTASPIKLTQRAKTMFMQLLKDIHGENQIVPISGFRSIKEQDEIFHAALSKHGSEFTKKYVASPGCSEHQTGLAIDLAENKPDIDFFCPDFPHHGVFQIFREQAQNYGFIQRYQEGKEHLTGIACEPWHFRYVGFPHSAIMEKQQLCLEEYLEYVKGFPFGRKTLTFQSSNLITEICYLQVEENQTIYLPDQIPCGFSGNNMDGMVLTLWKNCL